MFVKKWRRQKNQRCALPPHRQPVKQPGTTMGNLPSPTGLEAEPHVIVK